MKMKQKLFLTVLTLILCLGFSGNLVFASTENGLFTQDELKYDSNSPVKKDYNQYPLSNYKLEIKLDNTGALDFAGKASNIMKSTLNDVDNLFLSLNILFARFVILLVENVYSTDIIDGTADAAGAIIMNIKNSLWGMLLTGLIASIGAYAVYLGMIKRQMASALSALLASLTVFVLSLGFIINADKVLKGMNNWSTEVGNSILGSVNSLSGENVTKENAPIMLGNQVWNLMVMKPYLILQYGTTEVDANRVDGLLKLSPLDDDQNKQRQQIVDNEYQSLHNGQMSPNASMSKLGFLLILTVSNLIIGVVLGATSSLIILYQLIALVLALLSPIICLFAIFPSSIHMAKDLAFKFVGAHLMKIAVSVFLSLLFFVSNMLYTVGETKGYLFALALQIILFLGLTIKRKMIFSTVLAPVRGETGSTGTTLSSVTGMAANMLNKGYRSTKEALRNSANPLHNTNRGNAAEQGNSNDSVLPEGVRAQLAKKRPNTWADIRKKAVNLPADVKDKANTAKEAITEDLPLNTKHAAAKAKFNLVTFPSNAKNTIKEDLLQGEGERQENREARQQRRERKLADIRRFHDINAGKDEVAATTEQPKVNHPQGGNKRFLSAEKVDINSTPTSNQTPTPKHSIDVPIPQQQTKQEKVDVKPSITPPAPQQPRTEKVDIKQVPASSRGTENRQSVEVQMPQPHQASKVDIKQVPTPSRGTDQRQTVEVQIPQQQTKANKVEVKPSVTPVPQKQSRPEKVDVKLISNPHTDKRPRLKQ
jgi:hypothetical protein